MRHDGGRVARALGTWTLLLALPLAAACATAGTDAGAAAAADGKGASQIWTESCSRCHVLRSPSTYGDARWEAALLHMRVRMPLPPREQRAVLGLMQAGN